MDAIELIEFSTLSPMIKHFLIGMVGRDINVEIYDSFSELIFSKGVRWVRECDNEAYYDSLVDTFRPGTSLALVRKDLFRDFTMGDVEDQAQIRDMKNQMEDQDENSI